MRKEIFTSVAALAAVLFLSQGTMAQQDDAGAAGQSQQRGQSQSDESDSGSARQAGQSDTGSAEQAGRRGQAGQSGRSGQQSARSGQSQNFDQKFVEFASTNDQFEIQAAQLAEQQATDDQIKQMARMIRQDHQRSSQQLQQVAQQAGAQVSQQLKPHQQAMLQELKQLQGQDFDRAWLYGNIAGHTKAVLKFRDATREAQNPQLKQFAQQTLPTIQKHLQHAQQMAQFEEAQTAGASERGSGHGASDSDAAGTSGSRSGTRSGTRSGGDSDTGTSGSRSGAGSSGTRSGAGSSGGRSGAGASGSSTDRPATDQ